jgi:hypothetical protein
MVLHDIFCFSPYQVTQSAFCCVELSKVESSSTLFEMPRCLVAVLMWDEERDEERVEHGDLSYRG